MAITRAGNGFPTPVDKHHIFSVHTAVPSKGAAGFFYSTHFYFIPGHITKEYMVFIMGVPAMPAMRKAARLINAYCTDEARAGLLSELREMADGYKALCGMYRQKMEELLEEPAAYRHWRAQFNKTEVLHRRMKNNIKLISGGKKG